MSDKLSIVITCYNDAEFVLQAVESAIFQTYPDKEIILVDDGSNLQTKSVLKALEGRIDILLTQENMGVSVARNEGIKASSGRFILVLDSDDYFEPEFAEIAIKKFKENDDSKIVTCYARWFRSEKDFSIFKPTGGDIKELLFQSSVLSVLYLKEDFYRVGGYDEKMKSGYEDWEFYLRMLMDGGKAYVIPKVLFHYRIKAESKSTVASKEKYNLLEYIFLKHSELYKSHFYSLVQFLIRKIKMEEQEKIKNKSRIEFIIGNKLLSPLRKLKKLIKK